MSAVPAVPFHDGRSVPQLGYGVWQVEDEVAADVVVQAIAAGYRHIDTAAGYQNEGGVGRAVTDSGIPREDLFITTKLANGDQGFDSAKEALATSLEKLGTDYVDLYLIHWASPQRGLYLESWKALIELQQEGKAKSIGVSNFPIEQLEEIIAEAGVVPVMHQIELHPVIPHPVTPARIVSNFAAAELTLTAEEIERINGLDRADGRIGADPANPGF